MTITNEANRHKLKSRPGIILEFDPPRWDDEEAADTIGRVYVENGLKIYKLPGDIPEDVDLETVEPVTINTDGTVQQWFYTRTSDPKADTIQNQNRQYAEEIEATDFYANLRRGVAPPAPLQKPRRFDREIRWLEKSIWFSTKLTAVVAVVVLVVWWLAQFISGQSISTAPKQVSVNLTVLPEVSFQYTLPANQLDQQIKPVSTSLRAEADG